MDRETGRGETWTLVGEERRRDVGDGSSDDRKRKEEEEAEGAVKKRRRNDVGKSAEEAKEEESEGIRRFDGGEGAEAGARVIPGYFRKSGKLEEEEAGEEEGGSEEEAPCNESSEVEGRGYRSLLGGAKNRKSSTVYLSAEEKRISDGEQQSIVDGQIKRLISIRDDALDARAKADEMDEAKVLNFKREVEPEVQRGDKVKRYYRR